MDVLLGVVGLEMHELGDDEVGELVVDRLGDEDDPLAQQPGVDVEGPLAAGSLLDDHRNQWRHIATSWLHNSATEPVAIRFPHERGGEQRAHRPGLPRRPGTLTDPEQLTEWLAEDAELDLRPGGDLGPRRRRGARRVHRGGRGAAPAGLLVGPDGDEPTRVEIELEPDGDDTTRVGRRVATAAGARRAWDRGRVLARRRQLAADAGARALGDLLMPAAARADEVFTALSDPTRRAVLELIGGHGEATASQLARELPVSRQAVQKHLSSLAAAGLVTDRREGREVRYRITPAPMSEAMTWMATVGGEWDARPALAAPSLEGVVAELTELSDP